MLDLIENMDSPHAVAMSLAILGGATIIAFYTGQLAKLAKLPSLIGYMILGVILGPSLFNTLSEDLSSSLGFITQIALGFVAFTIGAELSLKNLKRLGSGIVSIIFSESLCAFFTVTITVYLVLLAVYGEGSWPLALIFGSVAPASAPAGTVAVIQECRSKGSLTQALYAVVGFDDGLAIFIFGFAAALSRTLLLGKVDPGANSDILSSLLVPAKEIVLSIIAGAVIGLIFCQLVRRLNSAREMLIIVFGTVLFTTGIAERFHLSLILTNMVVGFILVNTRREAFTHRVIEPLNNIMPLLFVLFFCLAGSHLHIGELPHLGWVGIAYILARTGGLIGGAVIGAKVGHVEDKIKNNIGLGILSQAGVAIGLSLIISHDFGLLAKKYATQISAYAVSNPEVPEFVYNPVTISGWVLTTITATCVVFEIIGPILTKVALTRAGEVGKA